MKCVNLSEKDTIDFFVYILYNKIVLRCESCVCIKYEKFERKTKNEKNNYLDSGFSDVGGPDVRSSRMQE